MIRTVMVTTLAACLLWPAASVTQEAPAPRVRPRPRVRVETRDGPFAFAFSNRGRIGVIVDTRADATGDKVGARIEAVTPGGPAEKAGLKAGDVVTRFNSTSLGGARAEEDEDSGPGMKLIELAHSLEPGDTAQIEYRRGSDTRKATIVAEDLDGAGVRGGGPWVGSMLPMERMKELMPDVRIGPGEIELAMGSAWGGIEMVSLNADLADYFGTREGVLVIRAPEDSSLALRGGDVIVSIGGRKPSSPQQAMRILRSYDPGETVTLDVVRKQKRVSVSWKVPENQNRFFRMAPRAHEEPSWNRVTPQAPAPVFPRDERPARAI
jgi:S1-C subfamily serine protease